MSDEKTTPSIPDDPASTQAESGDVSPSAGSNLRSGEKMVSLGGLILIVGYLVFGLLANEYWVAWLPLLLAVFAVLLPRIDNGFVEKIAELPVLMKAIGYAIAIIGVFTLIEDVRFAGSTLDEFIEIIGALVAYAGFGFAFVGARSIKT
jgi:UDP-N-acetylmuramyl pentapeptide phosphotransferase/UDP-N-acetylglucosamine-1-phosphate transferase